VKSLMNLNLRSMDLFNSFISDLELRDIYRCGSRYTWTNKQDYSTQEVLDRVLTSSSSEDKYPNSILSSLLRVGSDHSPPILNIGEDIERPPKYFRFESAWLTMENFHELVRQHMIPRDGSYILDYSNKKQSFLRRFLKGWELNLRQEKNQQKAVILTQIQELDAQADIRDLSPDEWNKRYEMEADLEHIYEMEELFWHKRCGEMTLLQGDRNTEFFHRMANGRRRKCLILSLEDEGRELTSKEDLKSHIIEYYKSLFRADNLSTVHLSPQIWQSELCLNADQKEAITRPFSMEELDKVIREAKLNIAPGPDGLNIHFYRAFWPEIKNDLFEMLLMLYEGKLDLKRLNFGVISLIPKSSDPTNIRQFRPICVLNDCFKFLSKVVTNRLSEVAPFVISQTQTAFIPGRFILEGCIILHEVLHEFKLKNQQGIILKIDFEKAYDRVSWNFLFEVLERKGFPKIWIDWIKACVMWDKVCVNINGERSDFFRTYRGLRQGDPLSPLLFNLVSDALAAMLDSAKRDSILTGLVPGIFPGGITHLQYADDTVIFIPFDVRQIVATKFLLYCFEEMAGMKINYHKSEIFTVRLIDAENEEVAKMLNCPRGKFPMKYLGLPISPDKILNQEFNFLPHKMEKRLSLWNGGNLTYAGRAVHINACLSSIPSYAMGFYQLPEGIHHKFDSLRGKYYWAGNR
jgi:hypothetical protein